MEAKPSNNSAGNLNWLWGSILIVLGGAALLGQFVPGFSGLLVAALFAGVGAIFFAIYFRNKEQWWAMIPGYILMVISALILFGTTGFPGEFIGSFVMFAIALPFFYVYLRNREHWWALIPAYAMSVIGVIIPLSSILHGELIGAFVMFAIALPFFYVFIRNREHWWALIPAGILALIGMGLLMASVQYIVPAVLIVVGLYLLVRQVAQNRSDKAAPVAKSGPDADKPPSAKQ